MHSPRKRFWRRGRRGRRRGRHTTLIQNCRLTHTMAHREEAATTLEAHGRRAPLAAGKIKPEATKGGGRGGGGNE